MYGTILSHVLVQLLLIILLSLFSYIFIETRFSKFLDSYRFKPSLLAVFVSSICLSLYTISIQKFSKLLYLDKGNVLKDTTPNPLSLLSSCPYDSQVLIFGDSHAGHLSLDQCSNNRNVKIYSSAGTPYPPVLYSNSLAGRTYAQSFDLARDHTTNSVFINSSSKHPLLFSLLASTILLTIMVPLSMTDFLFNSSGLPSSKSQAFAEWISLSRITP